MATTNGTESWGAIWDGKTAMGLGSAGLLERFADDRDSASFEAIIQHHGPMVLATCRRVLTNPADADDAFQATFLVLARQARAIRDPDRLAPWLHRVAHRVALRARSRSARRRRVEGEGRGDLAVAADPADAHELRAVLDEELSRLPAKYRDPLVLCYLEGLTHDEAAGRLDWPVGTVRSRLAGGRDRLRGRLTRRGFAPGALAILGPSPLPLAVVSRTLLVATARLVFTGGSGKVAGSTALVLAQGVLTSMFLAKVQTIAVATLAVAATLTAGSVALSQTPGGPAPALVQPAAPVQSPESPLPLDKVQLQEKARLQLLLHERVVWFGSDNLGDDKMTVTQLAGERTRFEIAALKRRLAQFPQSKRPGKPANLKPPRQELDECERELTTPTPELAGDDQYARDIAQFQERARAQIGALRAKLPADAKPQPVAEPPPAAVEPKQDNEAISARPEPKPDFEPEPTITTLPGSPTILMIVSGQRDRVTMIDPATRRRATLRLAQPAQYIQPFSNDPDSLNLSLGQQRPDKDLIDGLIGLAMTGEKIEKVAIFSRTTMRWFEHDLPQSASDVRPAMSRYSTLVGFSAQYLAPTRELIAFDAKAQTWPIVTLPEPVDQYNIPAAVSIENTVTFEAGPYLGIYSQAARRSSVLTLKGKNPPKTTSVVNERLTNYHDGKLIVADGDLIHIYDPKTAEWTEINTTEDQ